MPCKCVFQQTFLIYTTHCQISALLNKIMFNKKKKKKKTHRYKKENFQYAKYYIYHHFYDKIKYLFSVPIYTLYCK